MNLHNKPWIIWIWYPESSATNYRKSWNLTVKLNGCVTKNNFWFSSNLRPAIIPNPIQSIHLNPCATFLWLGSCSLDSWPKQKAKCSREQIALNFIALIIGVFVHIHSMLTDGAVCLGSSQIIQSHQAKTDLPGNAFFLIKGNEQSNLINRGTRVDHL